MYLNINHGLGPKAGAAIIAHPKIPAISFTGGTKTGEWIARTAAPMFKKLSLELGGKNPNLVFADCNFEDAEKTSVQSSFSNQGEICLCGSRIFVEKTIYPKLTLGAIALAGSLALVMMAMRARSDALLKRAARRTARAEAKFQKEAAIVSADPGSLFVWRNIDGDVEARAGAAAVLDGVLTNDAHGELQDATDVA